MKKNSKSKTGQITKRPELMSCILSEILDMQKEEIMNVTPFAKSIILSNESHPHVRTLQEKLDELEAVLDAVPESARFVRFFRNGRELIVRLQRLEPNEDKQDLDITKKRIDLLEERTGKILNIVETIKKKN